MIIKAQQKNLPITPKKLQLVANAVKAMRPKDAVVLLEAYNKKSAFILAKTIKQAMANATNNLNLPADSLRIKEILMGRGLVLKRFHAGARGRGKPYQKMKSHLTVLLESVQPVVTPAKATKPLAATPVTEAKAEAVVTKTKPVTKTTKKSK